MSTHNEIVLELEKAREEYIYLRGLRACDILIHYKNFQDYLVELKYTEGLIHAFELCLEIEMKNMDKRHKEISEQSFKVLEAVINREVN